MVYVHKEIKGISILDCGNDIVNLFMEKFVENNAASLVKFGFVTCGSDIKMSEGTLCFTLNASSLSKMESTIYSTVTVDKFDYINLLYDSPYSDSSLTPKSDGIHIYVKNKTRKKLLAIYYPEYCSLLITLYVIGNTDSLDDFNLRQEMCATIFDIIDGADFKEHYTMKRKTSSNGGNIMIKIGDSILEANVLGVIKGNTISDVVENRINEKFKSLVNQFNAISRNTVSRIVDKYEQKISERQGIPPEILYNLTYESNGFVSSTTEIGIFNSYYPAFFTIKYLKVDNNIFEIPACEQVTIEGYWKCQHELGSNKIIHVYLVKLESIGRMYKSSNEYLCTFHSTSAGACIGDLGDRIFSSAYLTPSVIQKLNLSFETINWNSPLDRTPGGKLAKLSEYIVNSLKNWYDHKIFKPHLTEKDLEELAELNTEKEPPVYVDNDGREKRNAW